jgi:pyrimidine deaminase RibD-like protein
MTVPDIQWMNSAIDMAKKSQVISGKTPIRVGAVIVKDGKEVAKAFRSQYSYGEHAEFTALQILSTHLDRDKHGSEGLTKNSKLCLCLAL